MEREMHSRRLRRGLKSRVSAAAFLTMNLLLLRRRAIYRRLLVKKKNSSSSAAASEREGVFEATATTKQTTVATTAPAAAPEAERGRGEAGEGASAAAATAAAGEEEEDDDVAEEVYEAVLDPEASKHCFNVLRVQVGDSLRVGVFNGGICEAKVSETVANKVVKIHLPRDIRLESPPGDLPLVDLLVALPRPKTLDKILQVAATLGVGKLLLVCARRSERAYLDSPKLSFQNISKQLKTGLEQGVATRLPEVHVFASWVGLLTFLQPRHSLCPLHATAAAAKSSSSDGSKAEHQQTENEEEEGEEGPGKKEETPDRQRQQTQEQHQQMQDDRKQLLQKREQRPNRQQLWHTQHEQHREEVEAEQQTQEENKQQKTQEQQQVEPSSAELPWCCFTSRVGRSRRLVAHPDAPHSLAALQLQSQSAGRVLVAVGPEGGWLPEEVQELQQQQRFVPFHLGDRVLRCETAVVSILSQVNLLLTDPTLRNELPPPSVEGSFSACLAPQSAAEPAGNSHNSTSCSSSCSSSNSGTKEEGTEATPAHRAPGRTVRNSSSGSTGCEDSSSTGRPANTNLHEYQKGVKISTSPSENTSSPTHCFSYTGTVTPRRVPPAAGYKMDEGAFSNTSDKDDSLNREGINDYSCTRGPANRIESYYKGRVDQRSCKRHNITETGVCPERLEEGGGHAVAREEQREAEHDTGKANEGGSDEEDRQNGEASAVVRPVRPGGVAAIAAAVAERQNDSKPAGVPAARAREETVGCETTLEKRELNTEQGFHRGRRLVYKDEDGFYIVLPERRHTKTAEQTPA